VHSSRLPKQHTSTGYCANHYSQIRERRHKPGMRAMSPTPVDRSWASEWFPGKGRRLGRWLSIRRDIRRHERRCECGNPGRIILIKQIKRGRRYFHTRCLCNACIRRRVRGDDALAIFERDEWLCWICGRLTDVAAELSTELYPTIDHVHPISRGGGDEPENLRCCCFRCNVWKSDRLYPNETGPLPFAESELTYVCG
jgi:hypothetical protein